MSSRRRFLLAGLGAACALPFAGRAWEPAPMRVLTATDVHVRDYPTVAAVRWIGEQLTRETGGRLGLRVYHGGQLGRESDAIDMARFGAIDIVRVYSGALNNAFPLTQALCLPYVFDSVAHMRRVIDGEVGTAVLRGFEARGLVGLAIYDSGARCFYNTRRPLHTPADLHGLKFRAPPSDIFIRMLRLFGANPTPLSFGEVFSALETRLIDGAENNMRSFHSSRQFEVARYWSQTEHSYAPDVLLISRRSFEALAPDERALLLDTARRSVAVMRRLWDESEAAARQAVIDAGVHINTVDMVAFAQAAQPLLDDHLRRPGIAELYRRIRDLA
ncbi:TRAP transporter substrate-binding protein [Rehaibacterium terrae]|jgi:tripartite ATP-independent transporter DctP family solute receptor|uniref:Tripartite ATP-independent transporter DctP family solute receptor n=1 Tax=Rehaibacterium terrae TaxID=1341696 RepID=A0A7W7XYH3_9GAMM|nr:TRAP transporter substrate-binding protein [Rehaibacterium terrae]MBB5014755.1 tripartite ATP-independent transporter DctP family solute receptor [Rehaibacterium terrae]